MNVGRVKKFFSSGCDKFRGMKCGALKPLHPIVEEYRQSWRERCQEDRRKPVGLPNAEPAALKRIAAAVKRQEALVVVRPQVCETRERQLAHFPMDLARRRCLPRWYTGPTASPAGIAGPSHAPGLAFATGGGVAVWDQSDSGEMVPRDVSREEWLATDAKERAARHATARRHVARCWRKGKGWNAALIVIVNEPKTAAEAKGVWQFARDMGTEVLRAGCPSVRRMLNG